MVVVGNTEKAGPLASLHLLLSKLMVQMELMVAETLNMMVAVVEEAAQAAVPVVVDLVMILEERVDRLVAVQMKVLQLVTGL